MSAQTQVCSVYRHNDVIIVVRKNKRSNRFLYRKYWLRPRSMENAIKRSVSLLDALAKRNVEDIYRQYHQYLLNRPQ